MAAARPILGLVSLIILAGGVLLQIFVILSGAVGSTPEDQIYFLQSTTNNIQGQGVRNPVRWTFFAITGVSENGHNSDYGAPVPALPFDPPRNFQTETGIPSQFIGTHKFFYLSRFMFAFYLIALLFGALAFFSSLLALCARLASYLTGLLTFIAWFFQALAASLMTAWVVQGRNAFRSNGEEAHVGVKAMAFAWASMACFFINTILFCIGGRIGRDTDTTYRAPKGGLFSRNKSTKSRGSFRESRIKDDYS